MTALVRHVQAPEHLILKVMERAFRGFQARTDRTRFRKGPLAATRRVS